MATANVPISKKRKVRRGHSRAWHHAWLQTPAWLLLVQTAFLQPTWPVQLQCHSMSNSSGMCPAVRRRRRVLRRAQ